MDDLLAEFVAETREMLQASEGEIVAWEADPADRARLDTIFRFVHTVKGNCGFFDFPQLERLSHAAESALAEVRAGRREADSALVTAVLAVIDRISEMVDAIDAGEDISDSDDADLISALDHDPSDLGEVASYPIQQAKDGKPTNPSSSQRTIRLPVELLDRVMSGVSDLVLARNDLARRFRDADAQPELDGPFERLSAILGDVRDAVSRMRMQRIEQLFNAVPRLVRDLATELDKQVMVEIDGNGVELDREMIELVRDPMTHIIRNAIGHGIEKPSERHAAGKREIGLLSMSASQSGNRITLRIADDGRGLDSEKIGHKALSAGIVTETELDTMDERQKLDLIFEPGLSTAETVDSISGRGVGLDVVRANVERLGGTIDVSSEPGAGTVFQLILPLTLSIIGGLTVEGFGQKYAIPRTYVEEIVHCSSSAIEFAEIGDATLVTFRGQRIRYLAIHDVLGFSNERAIERPPVMVVIRLVSGERFALGVDRVHDHEELVIKPLSFEIACADLYAGVTLLKDGQPILLLDVQKIAADMNLVDMHGERSAQVDDYAPTKADAYVRKLLLFDTLDRHTRAMPIELVRRIDTVDSSAISIEDGRAQVVIDGEILTLTGHERAPVAEGKVTLLRLSDGRATLLHVVSSVADTVDITDPLEPVQDDPSIEGVALIDGRAVPVADGHWLFASHQGVRFDGDAPICRLPEDSDWAHAILAPLVRAAGYRLAQQETDKAAVTFVFADNEGSHAEPRSDNLIVLREARDAPDDSGESIYRYDRTAILSALESIRLGDMA